MLLVTKIETSKVEGDYCTLQKVDNAGVTLLGRVPAIHTEMVQGLRFRNSRGEGLVLGVGGGIQEVLGLPMAAFEELTRQGEEDRKEKLSLYRRLNSFNRLTFWGRVKFFFTGSKV